MNRKLLMAILIVGSCLGVWKAIKQREALKHPAIATTEQFISYLCDSAVSDADTYDHIRLDYSVASLKQVDQILGHAHDSYVTNPSSIRVRGMAAEYGAYVGEVIRRNHSNAYWTRDSQAMGEKSYPLHWNQGESYPMTWCSERITNGEGDSIWIKYSVFKDPDWKQHTSSALTVSKKH